MNNLHILEQALRNRSFYILGAGASANIIPLTNQQGAKIVKRHRDFGTYSASEVEIDTIAKRLLGDAYFSNDDMAQEIINRIPSGAIKAISYQLMTASNNLSSPEQYSVLNIAKYRSVIFNFNVDGLASRFCSKHLVINAHGSLDPNVLHSKEWDELIEYYLLYSEGEPRISNVLLPEKEPMGITNNSSYKLASKIYPYTNIVILIGYSFGMNGSELDDWESYLYFIELFNKYNKPIVIISPYGAERIAYMLSEDLKRTNIHIISAYWNYLASAILESRKMKFLFPHIKDTKIISIEYIYQAILANNG